jgi:hypothetical protein
MGFAALMMAVLWVFFWPRKKSVKPGSLPFFILRWSHALTWLLLAAAAWTAGFNILGGKAAAQLVAFLGQVTYLVFIATVATTK